METKEHAIAAAFLFDAEHTSLGAVYGPPCTGRVIRALLRQRPPVATQIFRGDVLHRRLAYDVSKVAKKSDSRVPRTSFTQSANPDRYKLICCDLAQSLSGDGGTANEARLLTSLARGRTWVVAAPSVSFVHAKIVDASIRRFAPYLGMAILDTGNPLQMDSLILVGGAYLAGGKLYLERDDRIEDASDIPAVTRSYGLSGRATAMDSDKYCATAPLGLQRTALSERGKLSQTRVIGLSGLTHQQRLALALYDLLHESPQASDIEFEVESLGNAQEFNCEENKVRNYLLARNHPQGGAKAAFFVDVLGIQQDDWRYLADQIVQGMKSARLYRINRSQFGVTHGAFIVIKGRNGRTAVIETGWEIRRGVGARLVTAYPAGDNQEVASPDHDTAVPELSITGDARWLAIYNIACKAGAQAGEKFMPAPMLLQGYAPVFEGPCGYACVQVPNARSGFGKWLRQQNIGSRGYPSGRRIAVSVPDDRLTHADSQSLGPKKAYADAFCSVLRANGIECSVHSALD